MTQPGDDSAAVLPVARTSRWQPLRCGLVDMFYYDYQEFWFRDGRMLLRGNNGTGKSKVLALTLPFLLDGDLTSSRVEPDGDRGKKMEWNLLLGGRYEERLGYTWLEFGRVTEDGERAYLTIGCGMKAVAGRGIADRWFFITSQRVGQDLFLIGPSGTALTRDRLTEAIGPYGQVTQKAEQYRRSIDEHLFHLGLDRYEAIVSLLIQLRQPQLSKKPDEDKLSRALSEALTPVDQAVLTDIAAAFHDLEQQREELGALRDTRAHVARFLDRYRRYASVAARRQSRELRTATSVYEKVGRDLGTVQTEIEQARVAEGEAGQRIGEVGGELVEHEAIREELANKPELAKLAQAERYAELTRRTAADAVKRAGEAERLRGERRDLHTAAAQAAGSARDDARAATESIESAAAAAGIAAAHSQALAPADLPDGPAGGLTEPLIREVERAGQALATSRGEAAAHVIRLAERAAERHRELVRARTALTEREAERDTVADDAEEARAGVSEAIGALVTRWQHYAAGTTEVPVPFPQELGLAGWAETLDGENPAQAALRRNAAEAGRALAQAHAQAEARLTERRAELGGYESERRALESGELRLPPVPHTREAGVRDGRPGAPLWQVVDFAGDLPAADRAGLEAALEASGLLDAWLAPDGRLLDPSTHDTLLTGMHPAGRNLTTLLRPAIDPDDPQAAALTPGTVAGVLAGIGLEDGSAWVARDGRWRLGPLHGSWAKPAAEYLGHGAREEARRRRLAELAALIETAGRAVAQAVQEVETIGGRQDRLTAEVERAPRDQELRDAHAVVTGALRELERAQRKVSEQLVAVGTAETAATEAGSARDAAAADLGVPAGLPELHDVQDAVTAYRTALIGLLAALRRHGDRLEDLATWTRELAAAEQACAQAAQKAADTETEALEAESRRRALQEAIGTTVEELNRRLAAAKTRITQLKAESKELESRHRAAAERRAQAEGRKQQLDADLALESARRDLAVGEFQRFAATGLLAVAAADLEIPQTPWAPDPAVRLARRAEQALTEVPDDDETWRKVQDDISVRYRELTESLTRHGHHALAGLDDWFVVTIQFQGRERGPDELVGLLDGELGYRERILTAKERELLEEHLVNDVASHLQELIGDAEAQVQHMNAELEERPTSTGMRLRLLWGARPDGPAGLAEARSRLLRQDTDLWSADDRAAVGDFLQRQIEAVRSADEHGTWQEHLRKALDYRSWHRFTIERFQDGKWRSATGPASGGERVLTVSLPLFAAASAHYRSAHPHAPRLVMLDEAFAGVDDDSRAKCLGLLATFDLDVVMTSEREWGFYATVPGIATHQLVRRDGIDAVHVSTWEWDGATPRQVERVPAARAPVARASAAAAPPAEDTVLW
ncbi:MAG: hypothetical protein JWL58_5688 [Streptosporangiaceae bacterium]|nr:hypothetical protein [Streptosporangiaceae bacterium]